MTTAPSPAAPRRIVSLVPSLTETVAEIPQLRTDLAGITNFCTHPRGLHKEAAIIGGTKDPDLDQIAALNPSHILVNDEENKPEHIDWLKERFPLLSTFPKSLADVPAMLSAMAAFLATQPSPTLDFFESWRQSLEQKLSQLAKAPSAAEPRRFIYFIWREPYMVAGVDTYISRSLALAGYQNVIPLDKGRYPAITEDELVAYCSAQGQEPPELWLSSEPYPFRRRDIVRLRPLVGEDITIRQVDGRLHSWYGYTSLALADALLAG